MPDQNDQHQTLPDFKEHVEEYVDLVEDEIDRLKQMRSDALKAIGEDDGEQDQQQQQPSKPAAAVKPKQP